MLRENSQSRILYPAKLSFIRKGEMKMPPALEQIKTLLPPDPRRKNKPRVTLGIRKVDPEKSRDAKGNKKNWAQQWFGLSCSAVS